MDGESRGGLARMHEEVHAEVVVADGDGGDVGTVVGVAEGIAFETDGGAAVSALVLDVGEGGGGLAEHRGVIGVVKDLAAFQQQVQCLAGVADAEQRPVVVEPVAGGIAGRGVAGVLAVGDLGVEVEGVLPAAEVASRVAADGEHRLPHVPRVDSFLEAGEVREGIHAAAEFLDAVEDLPGVAHGGVDQQPPYLVGELGPGAESGLPGVVVLAVGEGEGFGQSPAVQVQVDRPPGGGRRGPVVSAGGSRVQVLAEPGLGGGRVMDPYGPGDFDCLAGVVLGDAGDGGQHLGGTCPGLAPDGGAL
jgi:hypothetical protein